MTGIAPFLGFLATIGGAVLSFLATIGAVTVFIGKTLRAIVTPPFYFGELGRQIMRIGYSPCRWWD